MGRFSEGGRQRTQETKCSWPSRTVESNVLSGSCIQRGGEFVQSSSASASCQKGGEKGREGGRERLWILLRLVRLTGVQVRTVLSREHEIAPPLWFPHTPLTSASWPGSSQRRTKPSPIATSPDIFSLRRCNGGRSVRSSLCSNDSRRSQTKSFRPALAPQSRPRLNASYSVSSVARSHFIGISSHLAA